MQKIITSLLFCLALAASLSAQPTARWYSYGTYLDSMYHRQGGSSGYAGVIMWNDDSCFVREFPTPFVAHSFGVVSRSVASVFMPWAPGFNDPSVFPAAMALDSTDAYTVDTLRIYGRHNFNPAKTAIVDTLIITTLHGEDITTAWMDYAMHPSVLTGYGIGPDSNMYFALVPYDSVTNTAKNVTGPPVNTQRILITAAMWGDTTADGTFVLNVPVNIVAAANEKVAASLTFKSGDPAYPMTGDTIERFNGYYEYNSFYPITQFNILGTGDLGLPYFLNGDYNEALYKIGPNFENGWQDYYIPMWFLTLGEDYRQHLFMAWHATSTTGSAVGVKNNVASVPKVNVYPSPASNILQVRLPTTEACHGTATLQNMFGQIVATQPIINNAAMFNTSTLPSGLYTWSVTTGNKPVTGKVSVIH